jgi:hypothetical protein
MEPSSAEQIIGRVLMRYATCDSYADRGRYESVHNPDGPPSGRRYKILHFETRFRRPDHFYFEFSKEAPGPRESWDRFVIWQAGGACRNWWTHESESECEGLGLAVAGATGISRSTALTVPSLLMPERIDSSVIPGLLSCERLDDAEIDGRAHWCVRPRADAVHGIPDRYAIDPRTLLIRRVEGRTEITPAHSLEMLEHSRTLIPPEQFAALEARVRARTQTQVSTDRTDYTAEFDIDLDDAAFAFEPG